MDTLQRIHSFLILKSFCSSLGSSLSSRPGSRVPRGVYLLSSPFTSTVAASSRGPLVPFALVPLPRLGFPHPYPDHRTYVTFCLVKLSTHWSSTIRCPDTLSWTRVPWGTASLLVTNVSVFSFLTAKVVFTSLILPCISLSLRPPCLLSIWRGAGNPLYFFLTEFEISSSKLSSFTDSFVWWILGRRPPTPVRPVLLRMLTCEVRCLSREKVRTTFLLILVTIPCVSTSFSIHSSHTYA